MNPLTSPRWQIAAGTCACAAAGTYVYAVDPANGGYPHCLLYQATGIYCAGCGTTRAVHALLHGRVLEALHDNLFFMTLLPVLAVTAGIYAARAWRENRWPLVQIGTRTLVWRGAAFVFVALVFMALRNVPGAPFELLRPIS